MSRALWLSAVVVMFVGRMVQSADLRIGHFEITQGLQDGANSIPLVLGKPAVIRVFPVVVNGGATVANVDARLRAFRGSMELPGSPLQSDNGPISADGSVTRSKHSDSLNFTLETDWYEKDTRFRAELIIPAGFTDADATNNSQEFNAQYVDRSGYSIRFLRIHYNHPNWMGAPRPSPRVAGQEACDFMRCIFPVDPEEMTYAEFTPAEITFGQAVSGDLDGDALISELNSLWLATDPADRPDRLYAWTPANSYSSNGLSDPLWAGGQNHVCFGNDTDGRWRRTFAHEVGHNTNQGGLFHTSRTLQNEEYGYDVMGVDPHQRVVMRKYPPMDPSPSNDLFDVMMAGEVESHAWITPPHFQVLFQNLAPAPRGPGNAPPPAPGPGDKADAADPVTVARRNGTSAPHSHTLPIPYWHRL